jgi:hypothetical protein
MDGTVSDFCDIKQTQSREGMDAHFSLGFFFHNNVVHFTVQGSTFGLDRMA